MTKTISFTVLLSVVLVCSALAFCFYWHSKTKQDIQYRMDKYNHCLQIAMSESRQSGKIIEIEKAKSVCEGLQGKWLVKLLYATKPTMAWQTMNSG